MALQTVRVGGVEVSRLAIGGNPFSGFSHQSPERDREMRRYYTVERIKEALHRAEAAGINTFFGRVDNHVMRMLEEYWDEGGAIQWFAQTATEREDFLRNIRTAAARGAKGCYLHGGQTDHFHHHGQTEHLGRALETIRAEGMAGGFAAHRTEPHEWIRDHLEPDFQLCCYYDPSPRLDDPSHKPTDAEKFDPAHRDAMAGTIATLTCSAVHYKVLAAGRTPPREAFEYIGRVIRPQDVVLVGMFLGDDPDMIETNVRLFEEIVQPAIPVA
ncbi:MAG: hypothetical protein ACYS5V_02140 [Planctomycetota bacterium]|jgi:hypothetical protein